MNYTIVLCLLATLAVAANSAQAEHTRVSDLRNKLNNKFSFNRPTTTATGFGGGYGNSARVSSGGAAASASAGPAGVSSSAAVSHGAFYQPQPSAVLPQAAPAQVAAAAAPAPAPIPAPYQRQYATTGRRQAPVVQQQQQQQYQQQQQQQQHRHQQPQYAAEPVPQYQREYQRYPQAAATASVAPFPRYQPQVPAYQHHQYQQAVPEYAGYQPQYRQQQAYRKPFRQARQQPAAYGQYGERAHADTLNQDHYAAAASAAAAATSGGAYAYTDLPQAHYNGEHGQWNEYDDELPEEQQYVRAHRGHAAHSAPAGGHRSRAAAAASASASSVGVGHDGGHYGNGASASAAVHTDDSAHSAGAYAYEQPEDSYDSQREEEEYDESYEEPETIDHFEARQGTFGPNGNGLETGSYQRNTESSENHEDGREDGDSYYKAESYGKASDESDFMNFKDDNEDIYHTPNVYHKKKRNTNITSKYNKAQRETGSGVLAHDKFSAAYNKSSKKLKENVDQRYSKATDGAIETKNASTDTNIDEEEEKKSDSRGLGTFVGVNGEARPRRQQPNTPAAAAVAAATASFKKSS